MGHGVSRRSVGSGDGELLMQPDSSAVVSNVPLIYFAFINRFSRSTSGSSLHTICSRSTEIPPVACLSPHLYRFISHNQPITIPII